MCSQIHSLSPPPELINNLLNHNLHQYEARNQYRLNVEYARTKTMQDSFLIRGPQY